MSNFFQGSCFVANSLNSTEKGLDVMILRKWMAFGAAPLLAAPIVMMGGSALASQSATINGNIAQALLRASKNQGAATQSESVTLFVGFNFVTPSSMPSLPQFIQDSVTAGNRYYHQFLSEAQFAADYAPSAGSVSALLSYLAQYNIVPVTMNGQAVQYPLGINVTGTVGNIEQAFQVSMNSFENGGRSFIANTNNPTLPTNYSYNGQTYDLASMVSGVAGMTTINALSDHMVQQQNVSNQNSVNQPVGYSPQQMAAAYNVTPLYPSATGSGQTIGIATLAPFKPSDAQYFWSYYHIHRSGTLSEVGVDGQSTTASGKGIGGSETSLDVERSGSMAPGANVVVYEAPNTNPGFIDLFNAVATADQVQVMTTSWGEAEFYEPYSYAYMLNQAFMQGAAEGMTMMAASGDYGAYDGYPTDKNLAVDSPASSPDILAAGGTTLPQISSTNANPITPGSATTGSIVIPGGSIAMQGEQGWGWQYLLPYYANFGIHTEQQWQRDLYPVGSTGGQSSLFTAANGDSNLYSWWQTGTPTSSSRNVPDVSLNADPFTGYAIYDTNSVYTTPTAGWTNGWGGTSFAAPQFAGMVAVLDQYLGGPQGLINGALYQQAGTGAFHDVTQGNNWYYQAGPGWDYVTGLGSPNLYQLAQNLKHH